MITTTTTTTTTVIIIIIIIIIMIIITQNFIGYLKSYNLIIFVSLRVSKNQNKYSRIFGEEHFLAAHCKNLTLFSECS